jgi:hypothetical protein
MLIWEATPGKPSGGQDEFNLEVRAGARSRRLAPFATQRHSF